MKEWNDSDGKKEKLLFVRAVPAHELMGKKSNRFCWILCLTNLFVACVLFQTVSMRCFLLLLQGSETHANCNFVYPFFNFLLAHGWIHKQSSETRLKLKSEESSVAFLPRSQMAEELEKQTWNQLFHSSVNKPIVPIQPFDQTVYVNQHNSTLYIAAPLRYSAEKWLCYPESQCYDHPELHSSSLKGQYEFFEVQVVAPTVDIFLCLINIEMEKMTRYHRIRFRHLE